MTDTAETPDGERVKDPEAKLLISFYDDGEGSFKAAYSAMGLNLYTENEDGSKHLDREKLIPLLENLLEELKP